MESVTFTPHYTLRASSSGTESTLNIRYHARISNTTGEDWKDVSLAISTAQASETTVIPQMMRWTIDFQAPYQLQNMFYKQESNVGAPKKRMTMQAPQAPRMAMAVGGSMPGRGGEGFFAEDEAAIMTDMVTSSAEVSEGITSTFIIPGKQTIKDGEKNHTVIIRDLVLEGKFANICVPKIRDVAYLQVPQTSRYILNE
jgi:hypothetical protein